MSIMAVGRRDTFYLEVVAGLVNRGFPISHFLFLHTKKTRSHPSFKYIKLLDVRDFAHCEKIDSLLTGTDYGLPEEVMIALSDCERNYLSVSDRLSSDPATIRMRRLWFWKLASFWYGFLKNNNIKVLFFEAMPHTHINMIVFEVAKVSGIYKFFIERSGLTDRILLNDELNMERKVPDSFMPDSEINDLKKMIPDTLINSLQDKTAWQRNAANNIKLGLNQYNLGLSKNLLHMYHDAIKIVRGKIYPETRDRSKIRKFPLNKRLGKVDLLRHHLKVMWQQHNLRNFYNLNVSEYIKDVPHVVFYLNFEPERTSIPMGGVFGNISIAIDILSRALPENWILYVKEHPRQFIRGVLGYYYRDKKFYSDLKKHPNVRLLDPQINTSVILENCKLVATVSGSIGWEAAMAGKPGVIFGYPWYAGCPAVSRVDTVEACRNAINKMITMEKSEVIRQAYRYLAYNHEQYYHGTNSQRFCSLSECPEQELLQGVVSAVSRKFNSLGCLE